jgi:hypothetical protein
MSNKTQVKFRRRRNRLRKPPMIPLSDLLAAKRAAERQKKSS